VNAASKKGQGGVAQFLFGIPFLLMGGYFTLAGIGVLPLYGRALVPLWVIACAGLVFFIPGFAICVSAFLSRSAADPVAGGGRIIRSEEGGTGVLGTWGMALFISLLVSVFWGAILSDAPSSGNMPNWMAMAVIGFFTLVAVATVGTAIHQTLGMLRYGAARLVLTSGAAQVGGRLRGYVEMPRGNLPLQVTVKLQCLRYGVENSAGAADPADAIKGMLKSFWEESQVVAVTEVAGRSRINIDIPIPEGLPASYLPDHAGRGWVIPGQVYCQWKLRVAADVPGVDLARTFTLEVLAEEAVDAVPAPAMEAGAEPDRAAAAARVAVAELSAGRTPAAVAGKLEKLGLSDAVISRVFNEIGGDATRTFAPAVRTYVANLARIQAEVNSGQLMLLGRARGPAHRKAGVAAVLPVLPMRNPPAAGSGAPVLLADESVLCRGKWIIGAFLMVWGGIFGGGPLAIGLANATQRGGMLFVFFLIGCAAFCGGLWIISRRHSIWLIPGQGRIEERTGRFRADQVEHHDLSGFDRVVMAKSVSRSSKGHTSETFHVALAKGAVREEGSLALGEYSESGASRAAAMQLAGRLSLPLYDLTTDVQAKPVTVAASAVKDFNATGLQSGWWRQPSALVLVLANLVPVGGVLFAGWEVFPVMLLFWLENLVVGVITALKILACRSGRIGEKIFTLPFFAVHYGGFCTGHGIFMISMFGPKDDSMRLPGNFLPDPAAIVHIIQQQGLWVAVLALVLSHGYSFAANFIGRGDYRTAEVGKVMMAPYGRIVVLHVVILLGGFVVMAMDAPLFALLLLVILKIILDVSAHIREHRRAADAALAAQMSVESAVT